MATLALPICELEQGVRDDTVKAKAAARYVQTRSRQKENVRIVFSVIGGTWALRKRLAQLGNKQERLINALMQYDFTQAAPGMMSQVANSIDDLVTDQREMLADIQTLGAEIRIWWSASIAKLSEQAEHLDSIAESLHMETDQEAMALLSLAVEQVAVR